MSNNMKRLILLIIPVLICGIAFISCDSDKTELTSSAGIEGDYFGTATWTYFTARAIYGNHGTMTLELKNGKYAFSGFPHEQANISGNYTINGDKITFEIDVWETDYIDKNGNIISYDFDTFIIPQGMCDYKFERNKLKISKIVDDFANYEWDFEKK